MDNTSKVTKDPKRQERGKEAHQTYMARMKKEILEDNQLSTPSSTSSSSSSTSNSTPSTSSSTPSTSSSTGNSTPSTPSSTSSSAVGSNGAYIYGVGLLAILTIGGVCVFFTYNKKKERQIIHEEPTKPKRRHML